MTPTDPNDPKVYGTYRVLRGGGWFDDRWSCRASVRRRSHPTLRIDDVDSAWRGSNRRPDDAAPHAYRTNAPADDVACAVIDVRRLTRTGF
jgi:hypothetical protein